MKKINFPFNHFLIDNFLNDSDFINIKKFFNVQKFQLKHTDLFKFYQTDELSNNIELNFFKSNLDSVFSKITDINDTFYTIFAACYNKGDYLLCHDDLVDMRKYAFTYYLEDFDSGDFIMFNNDCDKEIKRIHVRKNRLLIFEVSSLSWHEVDTCLKDGRKSITGWLNSHSIKVNNNLVKQNYILPKNISYCDFKIEIPEDIIQYNGLMYNFNHHDEICEGKFVMRRINKINLLEYIAIKINGYQLVYINSYLIKNENYILLNDYINQIEGSLLDIFVIESEIHQEGNINLVDEEGQLIHTLEIEEKVMYIINRGTLKYFIEKGKCINPYFLVHMIYKKIVNLE